MGSTHVIVSVVVSIIGTVLGLIAIASFGLRRGGRRFKEQWRFQEERVIVLNQKAGRRRSKGEAGL